MASDTPPSSSNELPVAVIGGGAAGLAAAYRLARAGRQIRLFEVSGRLGGSVASAREEGYLIEAGPNSFQENSKEIAALVSELGLGDERIEANPAARNRYIVRGGKLHPVPLSPPGLLKTELFSGKAKLRLLAEVFTRPKRRTSDASMAEFVGDHFGTEIVDYALNPFISGIYAGDPAKLSARCAFPTLWQCEADHGSLIRGQIAHARKRRAEGHPRTKIISFRQGLQSLTDALARSLPVGTIELNARIHSLFPGSPWRVVWSRAGTTQTEEFERVILAVPAPALSELTFGALAERPLAALGAVEYPPVTSLFLGFRASQVSHPLDGFGALVPAVERLKFLGVLFSSSLFPGRAPEGHVALTVMVGGAHQPELALRQPGEIVGAILPELRSLLGVKGEPTFQRHHTWPKAIPQYQLGHERHLDLIESTEKAHPGLLIGGNVRDGISLPNSLQSGLRMAARALA